VVKAAKPRFPGHEQPKVPSWGYFNEADPVWAAKEIDLAADNGIDIFIYDWYWYSNTGQYLQEGLEKGFLHAPNRNRLKFALMWANHDWLNIQPATFDNSRIKLTSGAVSPALWDTILATKGPISGLVIQALEELGPYEVTADRPGIIRIFR